MALHKDLTGSDLHEPKGVTGASAGQVYVANGSGSGAWTTQPTSSVVLARTFADVSTAGDIYISAPVSGKIVGIFAVLDAAITVADANVTFSINGVSIDSSALVIVESGSAPGSSFSSTPSGHNTIGPGDLIKISTDGGSTTTAALHVELLVNVG